MFKKNKRPYVFAAAALAVFAIVLAAALRPAGRDESADGRRKINVWFLNAVTNTLEPEARYIEEGENITMVQSVFDILRGGPKTKTLSRIYPDAVKWMGSPTIVYDEIVGETYLEIEFSPEYYNMSVWEEQFFRASLVWSITELGFINDIHIFVDGQKLLRTNGLPLSRQDRASVVINPTISPGKVDTHRATLYFLDTERRLLAGEERIILVDPDLPIEKYIMEQLIAGPRSPGLIYGIPPETKIKGDVRTEEGICYVNLSGDFTSKNSLTGEMLRLGVYSAVNSLTELPGVNEVQFLIEGEKLDSFKGSLDLSRPLGRDESLIAE